MRLLRPIWLKPGTRHEQANCASLSRSSDSGYSLPSSPPSLAHRQNALGLAWRFAGFAGVSTMLLACTKYDTGEGLQNYHKGSMFGSQIFQAHVPISWPTSSGIGATRRRRCQQQRCCGGSRCTRASASSSTQGALDGVIRYRPPFYVSNGCSADCVLPSLRTCRCSLTSPAFVSSSSGSRGPPGGRRKLMRRYESGIRAFQSIGSVSQSTRLALHATPRGRLGDHVVLRHEYVVRPGRHARSRDRLHRVQVLAVQCGRWGDSHTIRRFWG